MLGATLDLEKLGVCECGACVSKRPVKASFQMPASDPNAPLRVTLVVLDFKTGNNLVFTNRGKLGKPAAAKAATSRRVKLDHFDYNANVKTFSIEVPGGEHRMAAV